MCFHCLLFNYCVLLPFKILLCAALAEQSTSSQGRAREMVHAEMSPHSLVPVLETFCRLGMGLCSDHAPERWSHTQLPGVKDVLADGIGASGMVHIPPSEVSVP